MNEITTFEFGGTFFEGLKIFRNTPSDKFYEELIEEGSGYSRGIYLDAVNQEFDDQIHIRLSLSIVGQALSILCLIVAGFLGTHTFFVPAMIALGIGFGAEVLRKHFKTRANEMLVGKSQSSELVKLVFNS